MWVDSLQSFTSIGVVYIGPERPFHGLQIGPVAIRRELDAVRWEVARMNDPSEHSEDLGALC